MYIANPIYDAVFKYLMNDNKVAKLLLSAILGREIIELEFKPTEFQVDFNIALTVFRIDFKAVVKDKNGKDEVILIELQKAKLPTDILRFRRYLGEQYSSKDNIIELSRLKKKALPIVSIYFLGHRLAHTQVPIIKVARQYQDLSTGKLITQREDFIESLTHDSYIIQIPFLKDKRRTELEQLLVIFDQNNITNDQHILNVKEEEIPKKYRSIFRRLLMAYSTPDIRKRMKAEDDIVSEMQSLARVIEEKEKMISDKEKVISDKEKEISDKEREITQKDEELNLRDKAIREKDEALHNAILQLIKLTNLSDQAIADNVGTTLEMVQKIRDKQ